MEKPEKIITEIMANVVVSQPPERLFGNAQYFSSRPIKSQEIYKTLSIYKSLALPPINSDLCCRDLRGHQNKSSDNILSGGAKKNF